MKHQFATLALVALFGFVLYASGTGKPPLAKADTLPFSSFEARWNYDIRALENVRKSMPDDLRNALANRVSH